MIHGTKQLLQHIAEIGTEKLTHNGCMVMDSTLMEFDKSACSLVCNRHEAEQVTLCGISDVIYRVVDPLLRIMEEKVRNIMINLN